MTTKKEKQHYDRIARLGCILCLHLKLGTTECEIHHIRRYGGKRSLAPVIGLCPEHHRGDTGIHTLGKQFEVRYGVDEQALLDKTLELLGIDSQQLSRISRVS